MLTPKEVNLSLSGRYQDVISLIEAREAKGQDISQRERYTLCEAYLQSSIYKKLFPCTDILDRQIRAESGASYVIGVGTLATKPSIMRARAHLELGDLRQAVLDAEKAYATDPRSDSDRFTALALLAYTYERMGDSSKAASYLEKLDREPIHFMGWGIQVLEKRKAKAFARFSLKRYREFLEEGEEGLAQFLIGLAGATGDTHQTYSVEFPVRFARAKALYETGRAEEAMALYRDLLSHPQVSQWGSIYWQILFDMGMHSINARRNKEGIDILEKAVSCIEEKRSTIDADAARIGFVGDKQDVYHSLIKALMAGRQHEKAFEYVERAKSRALVDLLASKSDFAVKKGDEKEIRAILAMNDSAEAEGVMRASSIDRNRTRSIQIKTREDLTTKAPELASLVTVASQPVSELQSFIAADEALIEYYYRGSDMYAFILSDGGLRAEKLNGAGLAEEVQTLRKFMETPGSAHFKEASRKLYERIFRPLERGLGKRNLTIVSHGALHYLPINALHDGSGYLIDRYSIRMMPSAGAMKYLGKRKAVDKRNNILIFGNPDLGDPKYDLEYAQREASEIAAIVPGAKVLVRKAATEAALRKDCRDYRYIHFATHGRFDLDAPLKSALLLAPDAQYNGLLTADKIYSLDLDADLVTLSACETGLSKVANGDDLVGLTRGFLYAGSSSIVASLWKVDDLATSRLMTGFYGELGKTNKREALRRAQLETKSKYPHPYYWASFQLTGNAN